MPRQVNKSVTKFGLQLFTVIVLLISTFVNDAVGQTAVPEGPELIHFGDIVDVDLVGSFEFDWRGGLTPEGFLDGYDVIEEQVPAICLTEAAVAKFIEGELVTILRDPKVQVRIVDRSNRAAAYLNGAVKTPHRFQIKRPVNLNELIVLSGGITDNASGTITIFRPGRASCSMSAAAGGNASASFSITISDLLKGDPNANPAIVSGDVITVLEADPIYMIGGVGNPRPIIARESMTLTRAVATAGGLSKKANESDVTIYRREDGTTRIINADMAKIEAKQAEDVLLKPFDIVEVAEKGGGKRTFPPVVLTNRDTKSAQNWPLRIID